MKMKDNIGHNCFTIHSIPYQFTSTRCHSVLSSPVTLVSVWESSYMLEQMLL